MADRRLFYLTASGLNAYLWKRTGPQVEETFPADSVGHAAFESYLARHGGSLYYLLVDMAEEGFEVQELPYVQGRDRSDMLTRKQSQHFYGTPLTLAMSLGRGDEGRRDERILFAGLTGYPHLEAWLLALQKCEAQVVGIYSMPFILAAFMRKQGMDSGPALLMTITPAGIRQTFCDKGQLRFSRLTTSVGGQADAIAAACASESHKLCQYLVGQRLIQRGSPIETHILVSRQDFPAFTHGCPSTEERRVSLLDIADITRAAGLRVAHGINPMEAVFLHLLVKSPPRQQFATTELRRPYRLWQAKLGISLAAIVLLTAAAVMAGGQVMRYTELSTGNELLQAELDLGKHRYTNILEALPAVTMTHDELRALATRYEALARISPGPRPLLTHISRAMSRSPAVELSRLEWWIGTHADETSPGKTSATATPGTPSRDTDAYVLAVLHAQLPAGMASNHRLQLETVNTFADDLRRDNVQVAIVTLPFETESGKSLRSGDTRGPADAPRFIVRVARKL